MLPYARAAAEALALTMDAARQARVEAAYQRILASLSPLGDKEGRMGGEAAVLPTLSTFRPPPSSLPPPTRRGVVVDDQDTILLSVRDDLLRDLRMYLYGRGFVGYTRGEPQRITLPTGEGGVRFPFLPPLGVKGPTLTMSVALKGNHWYCGSQDGSWFEAPMLEPEIAWGCLPSNPSWSIRPPKDQEEPTDVLSLVGLLPGEQELLEAIPDLSGFLANREQTQRPVGPAVLCKSYPTQNGSPWAFALTLLEGQLPMQQVVFDLTAASPWSSRTQKSLTVSPCPTILQGKIRIPTRDSSLCHGFAQLLRRA